MGRDEITDEFMEKVGEAIEEMFPKNGGSIDSDLQEATITAMYQRKTAIPLFAGDGEMSFARGEERQFDNLREGGRLSLCDVIF